MHPEAQRFGVLFLCPPPSRAVIALGFANKDGVVSDNLDILPADADFFSSAADSPIFRLAVNNKRNNSSATAVNLDIAHKSDSASVGFVDNLLAPEFCYAAIHILPPYIIITLYYMIKKQKQTEKA